MKVALDARWMQGGAEGGVARILRETIDAIGAEVDLTLLTDPRRPPIGGRWAEAERPLPSPWPHHAAVWLQAAAPRWLTGFDGLFHCPWYGLPFRQPVPMVVTMHDIVWETFPRWFSPPRLLAYRVQGRHAARTARRIITPSAHTAAQVIERYGVDPERVVVALNAVGPPFGRAVAPHEINDLRSRLGLDGRYVVALGGAPRRQLWVAVEAVRRVRAQHPDVTLAALGAERARGEGVVPLPRLSVDELAVLLSGATALCYPTLFEGFGLPALEASACGTPVVAAPVGALPEVLGDAAAWCDDATVDGIARGLAGLLDDDERREALAAAARARAATWPSWSDSAASTVRAYREAMA